MEGPTPVSSLIHSSTLVIAGTEWTSRIGICSALPVFFVLLYWLAIVVWALVVTVQTDCKRIVASSTAWHVTIICVLLCAVSSSACAQHLVAHAWFKCCIFIIMGFVLHIVHSNDIRSAPRSNVFGICLGILTLLSFIAVG